METSVATDAAPSKYAVVASVKNLHNTASNTCFSRHQVTYFQIFHDNHDTCEASRRFINMVTLFAPYCYFGGARSKGFA